MTASLRVKNDKYYVVLTHTTDGKKNQTWVSTGLSVTGNEGKARQLMLDMLGEKPEQEVPPDMLFSDAVRRWLEDVRHRVDEVTYQGYEVQARAHILPYFDDLQIRLCDVDGETLQTYINVKAKFGRSDGHGGLSAVSLRQHKNVLNQTLKLAQRDGLIQTNPADLVVMPHAAQFTGTFYTEAQMRDLLTAVKNERLYPIIYVTALYGLRRSEVLGLKWDSINFAMQTLTIRHTVARVTKVVEKNKTKNASSFRSFPLTDDAVRLFKILLQQEQIYRNTNVFNYFGTNEDVLQNRAYGDAWSAFYEGKIEPFSIQFSEVATKMLFTERERAGGTLLIATANRLQYMSNTEKLNVSAQMADRGIMNRDEIREIWNLPPLPDGQGQAYTIRGEYYLLGSDGSVTKKGDDLTGGKS